MRQVVLFLLGCFSCSAPVHAAGLWHFSSDPLNVEALTSPSPSLPWQPTGALPTVPAPEMTETINPNSPLTLAQLTELALRNNPQTREAWAAARADAAAIGVARADFYPQIEGLFSVTRSQSLSNAGALSSASNRYGPSLSLSYVLLDFGARAGQVQAARYTALASSLAHNRVLQDVVLQVEQFYYQLLGTRELAESNRITVNGLNTVLNAAKDRLDAGVATVGDVYQAETVLAQANLALRRTEGSAAKLLGQLANAVGVPAHANLQLMPLPKDAKIDAVAQSVEELMTKAKTSRPDLIAAEAIARAARERTTVAAAQGKPSLEMAASAGRTFFTDDRPSASSYSVGVNLRIPLFNGFRTTYGVRQAQAETERAEAARDRLYRQTEVEVWQAYFDFQTARDTVESAAVLLRSAAQSVEVTEARYRAGLGNILDLLTARSAEADARAQVIQARLDWHAAFARLNHAVGALSPAPGA